MQYGTHSVTDLPRVNVSLSPSIFFGFFGFEKASTSAKIPQRPVQFVNGRSKKIRYDLRQLGMSKEIGEGCQPRTIQWLKAVGLEPPLGSHGSPIVCFQGTIVASALLGRRQ